MKSKECPECRAPFSQNPSDLPKNWTVIKIMDAFEEPVAKPPEEGQQQREEQDQAFHIVPVGPRILAFGPQGRRRKEEEGAGGRR
jgi:hypothetical protein